MARSVTIIFPASRQWVGSRVVEQRLVTITPREATSADSKVLVWDKFGFVVMVVMLQLKKVGVQRRENNSWHGDVEKDLLPEIGIGLMTSVSLSRHETSHGHAGEHGVGADELRQHSGEVGWTGCKVPERQQIGQVDDKFA